MTHIVYCKLLFSKFMKNPVYEVIYNFQNKMDFVKIQKQLNNIYIIRLPVNRKIHANTIINPTHELKKYLESIKL